MGLFDRLRDWFWQPLMGDAWVERKTDLKLRSDYRRGIQRLPLKSKDDSIIVNFVGLIVDRAVSMLFGKPIVFDLPGEADSPEQIYIDTIWDNNHKSRLLKTLALYGAESGTCFVKILPDGAYDEEGKPIPRLVALDPATVRIETREDDYSNVTGYVIAYAVDNDDNRIYYKQTFEKQPNNTWFITDYQSTNGNRWVQTSQSVWEWEFAPIVHWQNLTEVGTPYGRPDITNDIIDLQDKLNFVVSNTAKIIKYHAHPKTWGRSIGKMNEARWGADEMILTDNPDAMIANLEMSSDLGSSLNFIKFLRQALFDVARSVDIDSLADKLGALTNFGLKVLYQDALSKLEDKRGSYGEGLIQINHILLELAGMPSDGGQVIWEDYLPANDVEITAGLQADMNMGLVSKQTAARMRGYDWESEEERLNDEKVAGDNVGAALLRAFGQGQQ